MTRFKVGVCEAPPEMEPRSAELGALADAVAREKPDLFLLNEMPFGRWIAGGADYDASVWARALATHEQGLERLAHFGAEVVAGSRPRELDGSRVNEAFLWDREVGLRGVHTKQFFPDEEGYYEARWFQAGPRHFELGDAGALRVGCLICTEVMFNERARAYGRSGAQVLLVPRAVGWASLARWRVAMRMAAIVSGCYVLTSNRGGVDSRGQRFGGAGWIVDPEGEVVAQTTATTPVVFHEIDTDLVARAQNEYPCYVAE